MVLLIHIAGKSHISIENDNLGQDALRNGREGRVF